MNKPTEPMSNYEETREAFNRRVNTQINPRMDGSGPTELAWAAWKAALAWRDSQESLAAENDRLRAALANSDQPCIYCSLPASEMSKCPDGFPGCSRADDAVECPHFGASLGILDLEKVLEDPEKSRVAFESAWKSGCEVDPQSGDYVELVHSTGWTHWCRALEYVKTLIK